MGNDIYEADRKARRLFNRLMAIPADVRVAAGVAVTKQAETIAATMRALAPEDTGALKRSIVVTPGGQSTPPYSQPGGSTRVAAHAAAITAGNSEVRYAHLVEYGTVKAPAHPFFWPGYRLHRDKAKRAIKRGVAKAVKQRWGKK